MFFCSSPSNRHRVISRTGTFSVVHSLLLKLINYSCSQKPLNDLHLGQVDESWYPNETPDETAPVFHLRWNMFSIWDQTFLIVSFEKTSQKLGLRASSRVPNTSKQMNALGLWPRAFICFSVFGTRDEALALVFYIWLQMAMAMIIMTMMRIILMMVIINN